MTTSTEATTTLQQVETVVTNAATDSGYRSTLLQAPAATLQSAGVTIPAGTTVSVMQNSATLSYLVVPGTPDILTADVQQQLASLESNTDAPASSIDAFAKLVIDSWQNSTLKSQLLSDPTAALAARGIAVPGSVSVQALEATTSQSYLVLPATSTANGVTIADVTDSIESTFTNLTDIITAGSYLAGLGFSITAIMKFKQHKDNPTQVTIGAPISMVFIAAALLFLPSVLSG